MATDYRFDPQSRFAYVTHTGTFTRDDIAATANAVLRDAGQIGGILFDVRGVTEVQINGEDLASLARSRNMPGLPRAVLVPEDRQVVYGMVRMYQILNEESPVELFQSENDALAWLQARAE